jgi:hypothetical protein
MANFFTHFSCLLDVGTPENAARALDLYNKLSEDGASGEPPSDGFLLSIQPEHGGTQLWMRDDETGDPERLIQFVKLCAKSSASPGGGAFNMPTPARARASTLSGARMFSTSPPARRWPGPIPMAGSPTCSTEVIPMPEIIETTVYRLEELSDAAKDKARAWYRQVRFDHDWFEFVYDDFERICSILGIDLKTVPFGFTAAARDKSPASGFQAFGVRATAPASRGGIATQRGTRRSATMRRRTVNCTGSPMPCRRSSAETSTSSTPP